MYEVTVAEENSQQGITLAQRKGKCGETARPHTVRVTRCRRETRQTGRPAARSSKDVKDV